MPRLTPIHWKRLKCIFEKLGFEPHSTEGSHMTLVKKGVSRPVVIQMGKEIDVMIIKNNMKTAGIDRDTYFKLLKEC